jgi:hypothetical protein
MKISIKGFIYHKEAETFEDCFDRFGVNILNHKFSVADGVSKSFFPGIWAELLVNSFISNKNRVNLDSTDVLKTLQSEWSKKVFDIVKRPNQKYYVKNFFAEGRSAAATFVGLHFFSENFTYRWESFALGDSFLFFVPEHVINISDHFSEIVYMSSKKSFEFDNFPDFFESKGSLGKGKIKQVKQDLQPGTFYLMTDALSEWFIEEKQAAINEINTWQTQEIFETRVSELRKINLQNDDSTILIIKLEDDGLPTLTYSKLNLTTLPEELTLPDMPILIEQMEDPVETITKKFSKDEDTIKLIEREKKLEEERWENEQHQASIIRSFEEKITSVKEDEKKHKNFWERKLDWFKRLVRGQVDHDPNIQPNDHTSKRSNELGDKNDYNSDSINDIDSITDKF